MLKKALWYLVVLMLVATPGLADDWDSSGYAPTNTVAVNTTAAQDNFEGLDGTAGAGPTLIQVGTSVVFEGATADGYEATLSVTDPTADRTITVPNSDQTIGTATTIATDAVTTASILDGEVSTEDLESGSASPGNNKYYGTDYAGTKGFVTTLVSDNGSDDSFRLLTNTNTPNPNWTIGIGDGAAEHDTTKGYLIMEGSGGPISCKNVVLKAYNGLTVVGTLTLPAGSVETADIAADAVNGAKIGDDIINSEHYAAASIDNEHIAADAINAALIADDIINSEHYVDGSIDAAHLATSSVTSAKILDDTVDSADYAAASIDEEHLASSAVSFAKLKLTAVLDSNRIVAADTEYEYQLDSDYSSHESVLYFASVWCDGTGTIAEWFFRTKKTGGYYFVLKGGTGSSAGTVHYKVWRLD